MVTNKINLNRISYYFIQFMNINVLMPFTDRLIDDSVNFK